MGLGFAMAFNRTAPAVQRCKNQQQRCSYGRDRVGARRYFGEDARTSDPLVRNESKETFRKLESKIATVYRMDFFRWRSAASLRDDLLAGLRGRRLHEQSIMNGDHLAEVIRANVGGDLTFQEAFDKTGRILNVPVKAVDLDADAAARSTTRRAAQHRMLNYLTAPHVVVWSASRASCSVPGVYAPFPLLACDPDGSLRYEGQPAGSDDFEPTLHRDPRGNRFGRGDAAAAPMNRGDAAAADVPSDESRRRRGRGYSSDESRRNGRDGPKRRSSRRRRRAAGTSTGRWARISRSRR